MKALSRIGAVALAVCVAGCAVPGTSTAPAAVVTPATIKVLPAERLKDAVVIGKSTRGDVLAALGETLVISFDSGFEVWVYRFAGETRLRSAPPRPDTTAEFVVLFAPTGVVAKTRIRPPPHRP